MSHLKYIASLKLIVVHSFTIIGLNISNHVAALETSLADSSSIFVLSVYLFVHYSIRLDDTTSSQLMQIKDGYDLSSVPKKKGNHLIKGPSTVTVTVKETVTLYHDSPEAVLEEEPDSKHMCDPYMTPGYFSYKDPALLGK